MVALQDAADFTSFSAAHALQNMVLWAANRTLSHIRVRIP